MSEHAVGKNGIGPPRLAAAVILHPGDPGFPTTDDGLQPTRQETTMLRPQISAHTRQCVQCKQEFERRSNSQQRCPSCAGKVTAPNKPATVAAEAISNLRQKVAPSAKANGHAGDLHQQLAARRAQLVSDIEAIDRVLAIV